MTAAAWVCLFSPLAAAVLITLGGTRIPRRIAGYLATASVAVAFVAAVVDFFAVLGRSDSDQQQISTAWTWLEAGNFNVGLSVLVDPLDVDALADATRSTGLRTAASGSTNSRSTACVAAGSSGTSRPAAAQASAARIAGPPPLLTIATRLPGGRGWCAGRFCPCARRNISRRRARWASARAALCSATCCPTF